MTILHLAQIIVECLDWIKKCIWKLYVEVASQMLNSVACMCIYFSMNSLPYTFFILMPCNVLRYALFSGEVSHKIRQYAIKAGYNPHKPFHNHEREWFPSVCKIVLTSLICKPDSSAIKWCNSLMAAFSLTVHSHVSSIPSKIFLSLELSICMLGVLPRCPYRRRRAFRNHSSEQLLYMIRSDTI